MTLEELYQAKGSLITQIEVAQAKLKAVNDEIVKRLNEPQKPSNVVASEE